MNKFEIVAINGKEKISYLIETNASILDLSWQLLTQSSSDCLIQFGFMEPEKYEIIPR